MSLGGLKRLASAAAVLALLLPAAPAAALDSSMLRAELDARRAERAAAREQRAAARAERLNELFGPADVGDPPGGGAEQGEESPCRCSARISLASPDLQFRGTTLMFIPRVDVSVRTRGEAEDGDWTVDLAWNGGASFASDDVLAPAPVTFNGERHLFGGQCGDNSYSYRGLALEEVPLSGVVRSLFGPSAELNGTAQMQAQLTGCDPDMVHQQFPFTVKEFGNLSIRNWRRVR